jgi:predicted nucleic acid-binding protein
MKRIYLDTSVVNVWLFGEKIEPLRYPPVAELFKRLDAGEFQGLISLYTLQEVYAFCEDNFPADEAREAAKLAFRELLNTSLEIAPMLKRLERLLHLKDIENLLNIYTPAEFLEALSTLH